MNIFAWIVVAYLSLGALVSIATVGKPRVPTTPDTVAGATVLTAALIALVVLAATA